MEIHKLKEYLKNNQFLQYVKTTKSGYTQNLSRFEYDSELDVWIEYKFYYSNKRIHKVYSDDVNKKYKNRKVNYIWHLDAAIKYFEDLVEFSSETSSEVTRKISKIRVFHKKGEDLIKSKLYDYLNANPDFSIEMYKEEFNIKNSRADLVAINEFDIIVFEIKSHMDTFVKLEKQLNDYLSITSNVNLVIDTDLLKPYEIQFKDNYIDKINVYAFCRERNAIELAIPRKTSDKPCKLELLWKYELDCILSPFSRTYRLKNVNHRVELLKIIFKDNFSCLDLMINKLLISRYSKMQETKKRILGGSIEVNEIFNMYGVELNKVQEQIDNYLELKGF